MENKRPKYTNMKDETNYHIKVINVIKITKITTKGIGSQTQTKDTSEAGTTNNNNIAKATGPNTCKTEERRDPNTIATNTAQKGPRRTTIFGFAKNQVGHSKSRDLQARD